jgi:hypothetical protein
MPALRFETEPQVQDYLERVRTNLQEVPAEERDYLVQQAEARVDLALELEQVAGEDPVAVCRALAKLGDPASLAQRLRAQTPVREEVEPEGRLAPCRSCRKEVSTEAMTCPRCGAPHPARQGWRGWGYEYKSKTTVLGVPLVHVAFGRDSKGKLRVAKGIVAIGQFGIGAVTIAQFGVGAIFGLGQFVVAPLAIGQFAFGLAAAGQFGLGILYGIGQVASGIFGRLGQIEIGPLFGG